ncbi:MAG: DUF3782 domain-containing protein [Nitrososphaerales archaeon]
MNELKAEFLKLLRENKEFRHAIAGYIGFIEILARLEEHDKKFIEILARLEEHDKKFIEILARLEEHDKKFIEILARLNKHEEIFVKHDEELAKLREDMNKGFILLERHISALGARWGLMSEEAFREGLRGLLEREFGFTIEKWRTYDEHGKVFGYPSEIDVDITVKDEKIILIEVASHVKASDIYQFKRKAELYIEKTGKRPNRLLIVTPYIDEKALEASKQLNIEVYTKLTSS